MIDWEV